MEYQYKNCNEEAGMYILGRITMLLPHLEVDMQKQLDVKRAIDEVLYKYEVTTKETALTTSDIEQKVSLYLACKKLEGQSKGTLYNKQLNLAKFDTFFNKPINTITSMDIRMFMAFISEGRTESTINIIMSSVRDFFDWCQNEEYIISNPCKKVKPVKEPHREKIPLTIQEIETIRDSALDLRQKALFEFLVSSGCRVGELVGVKIKEINWTDRSLLVIGKGDKQRKAYFSERAKICMLKYIKNRKGDNNEYLFVADKKPFKYLKERGIQTAVDKIQEVSGVESNLHPHIFRHTYATQSLHKGMPIELLQKLLGHEKIETTLKYAKVQEANIAYMYNKISA